MKQVKLNIQDQINLTKILFALLSVVVCHSVYGQQAISAAGGNASGSGGSASYTVGQVVYTTKSSSGGTVSEGVQQSYEISILLSVDEAKIITLTCSVFPNPVISDLTLQVEENYPHPLAYQLYSLKGQVLQSAKIVSSETTISMGNLTGGLYFLRIIETKGVWPLTNSSLQVVKIFKIIKN